MIYVATDAWYEDYETYGDTVVGVFDNLEDAKKSSAYTIHVFPEFGSPPFSGQWDYFNGKWHFSE